MNIETLKAAGIDYEAGVNRFIGDSALYEELLISFSQSDSLKRAIDAYTARETEQLMLVAHEIKGVSGNMDMTKLYKSACVLVDLIRKNEFTDATLSEAFNVFKQAYDEVLAAISKAAEGN